MKIKHLFANYTIYFQIKSAPTRQVDLLVGCKYFIFVLIDRNGSSMKMLRDIASEWLCV